MLTPACIDSGVLIDESAESGESNGSNPLDSIAFSGCTEATPINTSSAKVKFEFPEGVEKINVYIDGTLAYEATNSFFKSYTNRNLSPGTTYSFACEAQTGKFRKMGLQEKEVTTPTDSSTPSAFSGIDDAVVLGGDSVRVEWLNETGVTAQRVQIFANPGASVDFLSSPMREVAFNSLSAVITNLGDEIPYSFAVRACAASGACDFNTVQLIRTTTDDGAPGTQGAVSASYIGASSSALVQAPWAPQDGGIQTRNVYISGPSHGNGLGGTNLSNYALGQAVSVSSASSPPTQILMSGITTDTHYFAIQDLDPSGNLSSVTSFAVVNYKGCLSTSPLSTSAIRVGFDYPAGAELVRVYQNGVLAFTSSTPSVNTFTSTGLSEGQEYIYECEMQLNGQNIKGSDILTQKTNSVNPPNFAGIKTLTAMSETAVQVTWQSVGAGVLPARFEVFGNVGSVIDWNASPIGVVSNGTATSYSASALGDGLPYVFGVRACSETNNCDNNTVTKALTLSDSLSPTTNGAQSASFANGEVTITAPWAATNGRIATRNVWSREQGGGAFSLVKTFTVSDVTNVPSSLVLTTGFNDNTTYEFYVQDIDGSGNNNNNTNVVSAGSGDLTAPTFTEEKFVSVGKGNAPSTELKVTIKAIDKQPDNSSGASHYIVYLKAIPTGSNNTACSDGVRHVDIAVSDTAQFPSYVSGNNYALTVTGLLPRTRYGVCVKARDTAGNISFTNKAVWHKTFDITPPAFGGLNDGNAANVVFVNANKELDITWAPSTSSDINTYTLKVWRDNRDTPVDLQTFGPYSSSTTNVKIPDTTYTLNDFEALYVLVNACDDALIQGFNDSANNCTTLSNADAKFVSVPDITPPQGFLGVSAVSSAGLSQGEVKVSWPLPSGGDWDGYAGFKIYRVGSGGTLFQVGNDVPCTGTGPTTSCPIEKVVSGLEAYKTYRFHVRAYDLAAAETSYLNSLSNYQDGRTGDTTAPVFSSNLNVSASNPPVITWSAATDNQVDIGSKLYYDIYRKNASAFANPNLPETDADYSILNRQTLSYTDVSSFSQGKSYFYVVCARDESANRTCDGSNMQQYIVPDGTPPILSTISALNLKPSPTAKTIEDKKWKLAWAMSDNATAKVNLSVFVYRTVGDDASVQASSSDSEYFSSSGIEEFVEPNIPSNALKYINYVVRVVDQFGNESEKSVTVMSDTRMSVDSILSNKGPLAGGNEILIAGNGFGSAAKASVNSVECPVQEVLTSDKILCEVPDSGMGSGTLVASVSVQNEDGTVGVSPQNYTYGSLGTCDQAANPSSAPFHAGDGSGGTPFVVCNATQFVAIGVAASGVCANATTCWTKSFELGAHIDFNGVTYSSPIGNATKAFTGTFDGKGFLIKNLDIDLDLRDVGIFGVAKPSSAIKNIILIDSSVRSISSVTYSTVGLLAGVLTGTVGVNNVALIRTDTEFDQTSCTYCAVGGMIGMTTGVSPSDVIQLIDVSVSTNNLASSSLYAQCGSGRSSYYGVGGFAGAAYGCTNSTITYSNFYAKNISINSSASFVGGLVGTPTGALTFNNIVIEGITISTSGDYIGGVFGHRYDSSGSGNVVKNTKISGINIVASTSDSNYVGGIGPYALTCQDCETSGFISGADFIGGIAGSGANLLRSKNLATVSGRDYVGGLIGGSYAPGWHDGAGGVAIAQSINAGTVSGRNRIGGLVGNFQKGCCGGSDPVNDVTDSYNFGPVNGNDYIGGVAGYWNHDRANAQTFSRNLNYGSVSASGANAGGFFALFDLSTANGFFAGNFWDTQSSGQSSSAVEAVGEVEGQNTAALKTKQTYLDLSWDFVDETTNGTDDIWCHNTGEYPHLCWEDN